jgi:hypothetical protein
MHHKPLIQYQQALASMQQSWQHPYSCHQYIRRLHLHLLFHLKMNNFNFNC